MRQLLIVVIVLLLASTSLAIVGGQTSTPINGFSMDGIASSRSGTSIAIGNRWFLSVAHYSLVEGNTMRLENGNTFTITDVYTYKPSVSYVDIKLMRVAEETNFWYDIYEDEAPINEPVIVSGTGYTGLTDVGSYMWSESTTRDWRWGTSRVSDYIAKTSGSYRSDCIQMNYNYSGSDYESGLGMNDSGSGAFVQEDEEWKLIGINAYAGRRLITYDTSYAISLPSYVEWIDGIVPNGDLDNNGSLDADDIDLLFSTINTFGGETPEEYSLFDLNSDGILGKTDADFMIRDFLHTEYADFNLDGNVDLIDLGIMADNFGIGPGLIGISITLIVYSIILQIINRN